MLIMLAKRQISTMQNNQNLFRWVPVGLNLLAHFRDAWGHATETFARVTCHGDSKKSIKRHGDIYAIAI